MLAATDVSAINYNLEITKADVTEAGSDYYGSKLALFGGKVDFDKFSLLGYRISFATYDNGAKLNIGTLGSFGLEPINDSNYTYKGVKDDVIIYVRTRYTWDITWVGISVKIYKRASWGNTLLVSFEADGISH